MRFVKAIERLPSTRKKMFLKNEGDYCTGWFHEKGYFVTDYGTVKDLNKIVWLDEQDEGWVPVEQFADFLDTERNKGLDGRGKESLWNDMKIWGKTTAFKLMLEKFKDRQPPATT